MTNLTLRERAILGRLWKQPNASVRELMAGCDIPSTDRVHHYLKKLNHLGYIKPRPDRSKRTTRLTAAGLLAAQGFELLYTVGEGGEFHVG